MINSTGGGAMRDQGRVVIITGPSCVGKTPLAKALTRFFPDVSARLCPLVLFNSRSPRPGEQDGVDYFFRTKEEVEALNEDERYTVMDVRGDTQALDWEAVLNTTYRGRDALFEGNPYVGRLLLEHPKVAKLPRLSIFIAPVSRDEIVYLKAPEMNVGFEDFISDMMRRKLLRRTQHHKAVLGLKDLETVERRAVSAARELREAWRFDYVIPNHDGEDSDNWEAFYYPIGDARRTLLATADLLAGRVPAIAEKWDAELVP